MIAILCASEAKTPFDQGMLKELYDEYVKRNRELGLTGYLSWKNNRFFQYLEGPENAIDEAIASIDNDQRQNILRTLRLGPIEQRRFSRWDMLNISGAGIPDIRIQDLIEDVMKSTVGNAFAETESRRLILEMLDQMSKSQKTGNRELLQPDSKDTDIGIKPPFVVVMGASAGGLHPLQSIIRSLKPELNAAFVVIQHFAPETETMMDMILQRLTTMKVCTAAENMRIEARKIYVIPPGENLEVANGCFVLSRQHRLSRGPQFPIDICFRSVAREYGDRAIAVILSGTGSDGSRGAKVLNEAGGVVLAQSPDTAEFNGMPTASIDTGMVHQILAPADIAEFVNNLSNDHIHNSLVLWPARRAEYVSEVVSLLEDNDVDFAQYKSETLFRRIERRRVLASVATSEEYIDFVRNSPAERDELREDILITVTSFFRDTEAWEKLKDSILPLINSEIMPGETFRVWVTACSTGEEAYTIGIILTELLETLDKQINFKIYATDIERRALEHASTGIYSERSLEHVSEERRTRFFSRKAGGYLISRKIRENVIFAPHNFIKNAPFTRMHLVTCRNVLIYMQPDLQQIAIKMLHFALNVHGILFLGPSETLGNLQSEFYPVQREWNQYKKLRNLRLPLHLSVERFRDVTREPSHRIQALQVKNNDSPGNDLLRLSLDALSQYTGSTNLLVDGSRTVMMVISDPAGILQVHRGEPTLDITKMIPESLRPSMTFAISRAFKEFKSVSHKQLRCKPVGQGERMVDIEVIPHMPLGESSAQYALVVIGPATSASPTIVNSDIDSTASSSSEVDQLRLELEETKKALQAAINDLESSNDEQRSVNEQLSAANEELQSTNEELQSVNEELYTVNFEYQTKIHELSDLNHDLDNLLDSTNLGVIFLDSELCIRRFTDVATQTVNLLPSDIGRPFVDLAHKLQYKELMSDMRRVLSIGKSISREISRNNVDQLQVGIHPYRAGSGLAQGVLIMFRDLKTRSESVQASEDLDKVH
ncbi:chemotaxis protein CheB [Granulosicoccus sp. 3-233]|uniref:chemotaxis protein CheB n=1 Tax=Granulosicoccus sp. 3-233 TaxID=3417969 RepID=UPI003D352957